MKRRKQTVIVAVIIFLAAVIIGPIIINAAYLTNSGYRTIWGAEEMLSYYGMVIAAVCTIFGVFLTIKDSHAQEIENQKRKVMPQFSINPLSRACISPFTYYWHIEDEENSGKLADKSQLLRYEEFLNTECYFVFDSNGVRYSPNLTEKQRERIKLCFPKIDEADTVEFFEDGYRYVCFEITNVGVGCANRTTLEIISDIGQAISRPISVPTNMKLYVGMYFEGDRESIDRCDLRISYHDIYDTIYEYTETLDVNSLNDMVTIKE